MTARKRAQADAKAQGKGLKLNRETIKDLDVTGDKARKVKGGTIVSAGNCTGTCKVRPPVTR